MLTYCKHNLTLCADDFNGFRPEAENIAAHDVGMSSICAYIAIILQIACKKNWDTTLVVDMALGYGL
eukprot:15365999-Ditylum_brightwellii.AAC.2